MRNWKLQVYGHLKCMKATRFPHATRSAAVRSCNGKCSSRVLASSALLKRKWIVMVLAWWVCDGVWVFRIETSTLCDNARFPGALEVECYLKNIFTITLINHLKTIVFVVYMSTYIFFFLRCFSYQHLRHPMNTTEAKQILSSQHVNTCITHRFFPVCPLPCYRPVIFSLSRGPEFVCSGAAEYFRCLGPSLQRWGVERYTGTALPGDLMVGDGVGDDGAP